MMHLVKPAAIFGIILAVFLGTSSLLENGQNWISTQLEGPKYCFREIDLVSYSINYQDYGISKTEKKGDELCFRTKDFSAVEKINQQIQDRKYQLELEKIKSQDRFYNEGLPLILLIIGAVIVLVLIILWLGSGKNYSSPF